MNDRTRPAERIRSVLRVFEEQGFGNAELLEGWDGLDLDELSDLLTPEEFQTLLDELQDPDEPAVR